MTSRIFILPDGCFAPKFLHSSLFDKEEKIEQATELYFVQVRICQEICNWKAQCPRLFE